MQMFVDFLPVIVFFAAYFTVGIYWATGALIAVLVAQIAITWLVKRTVSKMLLVSGGLAVVLGGITLALRQPIFIQYKLTVVDGLFALVFLGNTLIGLKPLTERAMGHLVEAPAKVWRQLDLSWVVTFGVLASANVYLIYHYDMDTWVIVKTAGTLGLTLLTAVGQAIWISLHGKERAQPEEAKEEGR